MLSESNLGEHHTSDYKNTPHICGVMHDLETTFRDYVSRITMATPWAAVCVMESATLRTPNCAAILAASP